MWRAWCPCYTSNPNPNPNPSPSPSPSPNPNLAPNPNPSPNPNQVPVLLILLAVALAVGRGVAHYLWAGEEELAGGTRRPSRRKGMAVSILKQLGGSLPDPNPNP